MILFFLTRTIREIVGEYSVEVRNLVLRIFDLICKGLGLEQGYFGNELSGTQLLSVSHYPRCPDPSLALGFHAHRDPNTITILSQGDIYGLQFLKDGKWIGVEPLPNAFVVIIGCQLQVNVQIPCHKPNILHSTKPRRNQNL